MNEDATGEIEQSGSDGIAPPKGPDEPAAPVAEASPPKTDATERHWGDGGDETPAFRWSRAASQEARPEAPRDDAAAAAGIPSDAQQSPAPEDAAASVETDAPAAAPMTDAERRAAEREAAREARRREREAREQAAAEEAARIAAEEAEAARLAAEAAAREQAERDEFISENSLGSLLYGARATLGKHDLKEVEREIRIKARYLHAIEALDPENLPSEAYLPGYVKTYAAHLRAALPLSPDEALAKFRRELAEKLGQDPDAVAPREGAGRDGVTLSEKVAPRISRDAIAAAKAQGGAASADRSEPEPQVNRTRPTPADALRARAEAARSEPVPGGPARGRKIATLDPMAKIERLGAQARAAAPQSPQGRATAASAEVVARRRKAALEREAQRAAEVARTSRPARSAALRGAESSGVDAVGPGVALVTAAAVIGGLSYGAWSLLTEAQKVTAQDEARPLAVAGRVDPISAAAAVARPSADAYEPGGALTESAARPALDGPIGGIVDQRRGEPAPADPQPDAALAAVEAALATPATRPTPSPAEAAAEWTGPAFALRALDVSWLRVRDKTGAVLFAGQLDKGALKPLDASKGPFEIRVGNAGGVALVLEGQVRGPLGQAGRVATLKVDPEAGARLPELPEETAALAAEAAARDDAPATEPETVDGPIGEQEVRP